MTVFDAVVAGGGPAGAAAALALARRRRTVLLVDPARDRGVALGESLPPAAWPLLAELGVADRIAVAGHLRSHGTLSAWGSDRLAIRDFVHELHGHGLHLDRRGFDAALRERARSAGAEIVTPAQPVYLSRPGGDHDAVHLLGIAGTAVAARWIVDATGRASSLARRLGARRVLDDALVAVVAELHPSRAGDVDSRLVIEARPDGWWYSTLTPSGARIVAFLADRDLIDLRDLRSPAGFEARLATTAHLASRLRAHGYHLAGAPRATAAASGHLVPCRGTGWLAVGDAALAPDPLSSQGIFHALYTGLRGGEAIADALDGNDAGLAAYEHRLAAIRAAYLRNRAAAYASEPRWADAPFWSRRRAGAA